MRDLFKGDLNEVSPIRLAQAKLALHDLLMALLGILLGYLLMADKEKPKTEQLAQYEGLALKTLDKAFNEFNFGKSIFGSIQTTPAFVSKLSTTKESMDRLFEGKSDLETFMRRNISFLEILPNPLTRG